MTSHADAIDRQAFADSLLQCGPWKCTDDDDALIDHANAQSRAVAEEAAKYPHSKALALAIQRAEAHYLTIPDENEAGQLARLSCSIWWRRNLRRLTSRRREQRQRVLGRVHDRAGIYVSHEGFRRRRAQRTRNARMLEAVTAINELDQEYTLAELAELGLANPENRRAELMMRVAETEREAERLGHVGLFLTITTPSRFHAVHSGKAIINRKWEQGGRADPREAQAYLQNVWSKARAFLGRRGLGFYGLRVVEPHHDGCPHWHVLLWCDQQDMAAVLGVLRAYAIEDSYHEIAPKNNEPQWRAFIREKRRFDAKLIDRKKGSAAGYVLKYITKNINGRQERRQGVEGDHLDQYGHHLTQSAPRIEAWAATWGIRQFQFFGLPSVTVWRQTRRIREPSDLLAWMENEQPDEAAADLMGRLWKACDTAQWAEFLRLMGGPMTKRADQPVKPWTIERIKSAENGELQTGAYGDVKQSIIGVIVRGVECVTQQHFWRVEQSPKDAGIAISGNGRKASDDTAKHRVLKLEREARAVRPGCFEHLTFMGRLTFTAFGGAWTRVNNCTRGTDPDRLRRMMNWQNSMSQIYWHTKPPADPQRVEQIRKDIQVEAVKHRADREHAERLNASLEEGRDLLISMLAEGRLTPNDFTPEQARALAG